jgi:hypothetical protein
MPPVTMLCLLLSSHKQLVQSHLSTLDVHHLVLPATLPTHTDRWGQNLG